MKLRVSLLAPALVLLGVACSPILDVHGGAVAPVDVSSRSTFTVDAPAGSPPGFSGSDRSADVARRVAAIAARLLTSKGYSVADSSGAKPADLRLEIRVGRRDEKLAPVFPMPRPSSPGGYVEATEADDARVGALVIDVVDVASGLIVWHGAARVVIDPDAPIDDSLVERSTDAILATFPARR